MSAVEWPAPDDDALKTGLVPHICHLFTNWICIAIPLAFVRGYPVEAQLWSRNVAHSQLGSAANSLGNSLPGCRRSLPAAGMAELRVQRGGLVTGSSRFGGRELA